MSISEPSDLKGLITANSFSGLPTFFRRHTGTDFSLADIVVYGLPFDQGVSNRPGARFGPRSIREASLQLAWGKVWPWNIDPFEHLGVIDAGDIEYDYGDYAGFREATRERARLVAKAGAIPFSLGGDHGVTLHSLDGLTQITGPLALLHFDAHTDTAEGPEIQHGTMFRHADRSGIVRADRSIQLGIRTDYQTDDAYLRIHAPEVERQDPESTANRIVERVGDLPCYVSFDIDCLDPAFAPGTGTPVPGGLSTLKILEIIRALGQATAGRSFNIVGLDIVEVAPCYDHAQKTALAAVQIAHELLCLLACLRGSRDN